MWKFSRNAQFLQSFGRFTKNYTEIVPFHKIFTPRNLKLRCFKQWFVQQKQIEDIIKTHQYRIFFHEIDISFLWWVSYLSAAITGTDRNFNFFSLSTVSKWIYRIYRLQNLQNLICFSFYTRLIWKQIYRFSDEEKHYHCGMFQILSFFVLHSSTVKYNICLFKVNN